MSGYTHRIWTKRTIPGVEGLAALALGPLPNLADNRGRAASPLVWMSMASHLKWGTRSPRVYVGNETIARETGLPLRAVEHGVRYLKRIGRITAKCRLVARYRTRRVTTLVYDGPAPRVVLPEPDQVAALWERCQGLRERAATAVGLAFAAHVFAACEHWSVGRSKVCETRVGELARFVGASRGGTFSARLAVLEAAGVLMRKGRTWARGFVLTACRVALKVVKAVRVAAPTLAPPTRLASLDSDAVLAAMSEAFARCRYA